MAATAHVLPNPNATIIHQLNSAFIELPNVPYGSWRYIRIRLWHTNMQTLQSFRGQMRLLAAILLLLAAPLLEMAQVSVQMCGFGNLAGN